MYYSMQQSGQATIDSEHIQRPVCCVLPERREDFDLLGSFVSLKDHTWIKLGIAIILAGQSMVWGLAVNLSEIEAFSTAYWVLHGILAISAFVVLGMLGSDLFRECLQGIRKLSLGIESLFTISLTGALGGSVYATLIGSGAVYYEVVIVVLVIYSFGRKIGQVSRERAVMECDRFREQFNKVTRIGESDSEESIDYDTVTTGNRIVVHPGQAISVDGEVVSGQGFVKETPLTGEPHPVLKEVGSRISAGTWSIDASLEYLADKTGERVIDEILRQVETSISDTKSRRQLQAEQWIQGFVIFVCAIALATGLFWAWKDSLSVAWLNSMSVLLIACPCALGLATPLAIWTGLWQLSAYGLISRSSHLIDSLANTTHLFFDKTGTLTEAALAVGHVDCHSNCPWKQNEVLRICAALENPVDHPIARAFVQMRKDPNSSLPEGLTLKKQRWLAGYGVVADVLLGGEPAQLRLGTPEWIRNTNQNPKPTPSTGKTILLAMNDQPIATITLTETLRPGASSLFGRLRKLGIRSTILTGDPTPQWQSIENTTIRAGLSPSQKAELVKHSAAKGEHPIFVGDGINDLDAMTAGFASISVNDGGSSLTQSASSAILLGGSLDPLLPAIQLSRKVDRTLRTNFAIAITYNIIGISLAAAGYLHPVASILIMIVSSLLVTFRAIRKAEEFSE